MSSKVVGMVGKARSGKDTFAQVLVRDGEYVHVAFADELKRDVAKFLGITLDRIEARKDDFRAVLQEHGSRMRREKGEHYWIARAEPVITRALDAGRYVVVTDVRYQNEAAWLRTLGGKIVKRVRAGHAGAGGRLALHSSETELDLIRADYTCTCDTIEAIRQHAREFLVKPGGDT